MRLECRIEHKEGLSNEEPSETLSDNLRDEGRHKKPDGGPEPGGKKCDGGRSKMFTREHNVMMRLKRVGALGAEVERARTSSTKENDRPRAICSLQLDIK